MQRLFTVQTALLLSLLGAEAFLPASVRSTAPFLAQNHPRKLFQPMALFARRGAGNQRAPVKEKAPLMNEEIQAPELRVVTPNPKGKDEPLGIMSRDDALAKAQDMGGLDLIMVNPNSDPPVCKIVDYSKYRYEQSKKAKEIKKNSKGVEVKEVKMSYKIDVHDYDVRKKNASKFLKQGNRVKCTVMFRGREVQHDNLGYDLLDKMAQDLDDLCLKEGKAKREGRNLSLILGPRPEVLKQINENRRREEREKKKKKQEKLQKRAAADELQNSVQEKIAVAAKTLEDTDDDDDDDDDTETSLEDLLGGDDLTDELFG